MRIVSQIHLMSKHHLLDFQHKIMRKKLFKKKLLIGDFLSDGFYRKMFLKCSQEDYC